MPDITLPADVAKRIADTLQMMAVFGTQQASDADLRRWADLLDPPAPSSPSLRAEVAEAMGWIFGTPLPKGREMDVDRILAVVRRHVEALPMSGGTHLHCLSRDDVLRMLGATDDN